MHKTEIDDHLKLLLYGRAGSTKTRTAASAALDNRTWPCLMLEASGNPISIREYERKPDILTVEQLSDINGPYEFLSEGMPKDHFLVKEFGLRTDYKTLIFDGVSVLQRFSFRLVTGTALSPGSIPKRVEIKHFNQVLAQMTMFAELYYDLPMHVIMTSLEAEKTDQQTGAIYYRPLLWGQSADEVPGYALMVMRLLHEKKVSARQMDSDVATAVGEVIRNAEAETYAVGLISPDPKYDAKDQYGTGLTFFRDPTVTKIMDAIEGGAANEPSGTTQT